MNQTTSEKLAQIATNMSAVYSAGYSKGTQAGGYATGYEDGEAAGKKAAYDNFWDNLQQNGNRTEYYLGFAGQSWNDNTFKPKYNITPSNTNYYIFERAAITNLKAILENQNVTFDTTRISYALGFFVASSITHSPVLDLRNAGTIIAIQNAANLIWVEKFILSSTNSQTFYSARSFDGCTKLQHCPFEGVIRTNEFSLKNCPLIDKETITSVVSCLASTTTGLSVTLPQIAINREFETSEGANDGSSSAEWQALAATRSNWTIALA